MKKKVYINVPEPCHENWQEMTPVEQGRHCGVCTKNVIDFTKFSDKELLDFLSTPQQNICGRFDNKQLNRAIEYPITPQKYSLPSSWLLGLSLLAGAIATTLPTTTYASPIVVEQSVLNKEIKNTDGDSTRVIRGIITDSTTNESLIGVIVLIKDTRIKAATDFNGKFSLRLPENYADKDIMLEVCYLGYGTKYVTVKNNESYIKVDIEETPSELTGEVVLREHCTTTGIVGYDSLKIKKQPKTIKKGRKIFGSVLSKEDGSPLMGTTISIQGTKYKTETDYQGNFSFNFPPSYFDSTFTLKIKMIGYSTLLITDYNYKYAKEPILVKLEESETIIVGTFYKPKRWQKIKLFFRRLF